MKIQKFVLAAAWLAAFAFLTGCSKDQSMNSLSPLANDMVEERAVSSTTYPLESVSDPDISGSVTFQKVGTRTKITIALDGTSAGNSHPAHVHFNSVAEGGGIAVPLTAVNGGSGRSVTIADMSYDELIAFDGHVNVHLSETDLATYVAQGNIGSNY